MNRLIVTESLINKIISDTNLKNNYIHKLRILHNVFGCNNVICEYGSDDNSLFVDCEFASNHLTLSIDMSIKTVYTALFTVIGLLSNIQKYGRDCKSLSNVIELLPLMNRLSISQLYNFSRCVSTTHDFSIMEMLKASNDLESLENSSILPKIVKFVNLYHYLQNKFVGNITSDMEMHHGYFLFVIKSHTIYSNDILLQLDVVTNELLLSWEHYNGYLKLPKNYIN